MLALEDSHVEDLLDGIAGELDAAGDSLRADDPEEAAFILRLVAHHAEKWASELQLKAIGPGVRMVRFDLTPNM